MDLKTIIIDLLGIQGVVIEDIKKFKKDLRLEVKIRQKKSECFCSKCGLQFKSVKKWSLNSCKCGGFVRIAIVALSQGLIGFIQI